MPRGHVRGSWTPICGIAKSSLLSKPIPEEQDQAEDVKENSGDETDPCQDVSPLFLLGVLLLSHTVTTSIHRADFPIR